MDTLERLNAELAQAKRDYQQAQDSEKLVVDRAARQTRMAKERVRDKSVEIAQVAEDLRKHGLPAASA